MQRVHCAAGAVVFIGHARAETVDVPLHISVNFPVAFDWRFTYCGEAGHRAKPARGGNSMRVEDARHEYA
jgi:hypothetical protein